MASGKWVVVAHTQDGIIVPKFRAWGPFYNWMNASNEAIRRQAESYDAEIIELNKPDFKDLD